MSKKINYYWHDRDVKARQYILNGHIKETEAEIINQYTKTSNKIINELTLLYDKLTKNTDVKISDLYNYQRYYKSLININKQLDKLRVKETSSLTKGLVELYEDIQAELNEHYNWNGITNKDAIYEAIKQTWCNDGKIFNDRITTNCKGLASSLEQVLVDGIQTGKSTEQLVKSMRETCNIGINEARRLIRTEMAHCEVIGALDKYKKAGITHFRWLTASGCCDDCLNNDMEVFEIESNMYPPAHPNCRCTVLAVID